MRMKRTAWISLVVALGTLPASGQVRALPSASDLPERAALPNPFEFMDRSPVVTAEDWARRRAEMRELLLQYQYGHPPPPPKVIEADVAEAPKAPDDPAHAKTIRGDLVIGGDTPIRLPIVLHVPEDAQRPSPVVVRVGLHCPDLRTTLARGIAFAGFDYQALDPDTEGHDEAGPAQRAYPENDWGTRAVWAWGASRVLDYLERVPEIDTKRSVITGHSRTGKAALLAGALDERFAVVVPNGSGCGGASVYRVTNEKSETLELITRPERFAAWFHDDFRQFADRESRLPFDQHFLRTLVAPRAVMNTEALDDRWANLWGAQAGYLAAQPVFEWMGVPQRNGIHFRDGQHDQLPEDFAALLDFAQAVFENKDPGERFRQKPFAEVENVVDWKAPEDAFR